MPKVSSKFVEESIEDAKRLIEFCNDVPSTRAPKNAHGSFYSTGPAALSDKMSTKLPTNRQLLDDPEFVKYCEDHGTLPSARQVSKWRRTVGK